jgi:multicomponent Na+:H+ antiporter subunit C
MTGFVVAFLVGGLFATGTYMLLRRDPIRLILGLSLLSYGVNVLLFSTSTMRRGIPPIIADKASFAGEIAEFVDPLPQALILTAIVISFGVTAFLIVLVNRRNILVEEHTELATSDTTEIANDPFGATAHYLSGLDSDPDDYEWLEDAHPNRPVGA